MAVGFGIDFGTTNSAVAINDNGRVTVVPVDHGADGFELRILRSALYFEKTREVHTGQNAVNMYIEEGTEGRFMRSFKSLLSMASFTKTEIWGKYYDLPDLVAFILSELKRKAEKACGKTADRIVLGRPVVFSTEPAEDRLAEDRLRTAAKKVGFNAVDFQFEPVAAGLAFEAGLSESEEKLVLIADFGGGTSDFSVIRLAGHKKTNRDRKEDILSIGGVYIGGDTFDSALMWDKIAWHFGRSVQIKLVSGGTTTIPQHIMHKLRSRHLLHQLRDRSIVTYLQHSQSASDDPQAIANLVNLIKGNRAFELFQEIERVKCDLSTNDSSLLHFDDSSLEIREVFTRPEFERCTQDAITSLVQCIDETLNRAGLTYGDIDIVFTTGGTSLIPSVRHIFESKFGPEKIRSNDAFTSVVYGLGLSARA